MANSNTPFGFKPVQSGTGAPGGSPRITWYPLLTTNAAMAVGDPCAKGASGVDRFGTTGAVTSGQVVGVVAGFRQRSGAGYPNSSTGGSTPERTYVAASIGAGWEVGVYDDPFQWFEVQCDDGAITGTTYVAETEIGRTADVMAAAPTQFSTTTGRSNYELDTSSADDDVNAPAPLIIMGMSRAIGNVVDGTSAAEFAKVIVMFTNHFNKGGAAANSLDFGV
jgi:hypothetical protein